MPQESVWVVVGECGEYSAREVWCVRAFAREHDARAFVGELGLKMGLLREHQLLLDDFPDARGAEEWSFWKELSYTAERVPLSAG